MVEHAALSRPRPRVQIPSLPPIDPLSKGWVFFFIIPAIEKRLPNLGSLLYKPIAILLLFWLNAQFIGAFGHQSAQLGRVLRVREIKT